MNGLVVWIVIYLASVIFIDYHYSPEGFWQWLSTVVISWVIANIAQAIVEDGR